MDTQPISHNMRESLRLRGILLAVIAVIVAGGIAVVVRAASMSVHETLDSLHATRLPVVRPAQLGSLAPLRDISLTTTDHVVIRGWYHSSRNHAAIILTHGYDRNRMQVLHDARLLASAGFGVLLFDWRGHGESGGRFVTWGDRERRDLAAVTAYVMSRPDVDKKRIGIIGFSLGGYVVGDVAPTDHRYAAVILEGTYPSLMAGIRQDLGRWGPFSILPCVWTLRLSGIDPDSIAPIQHIRGLSPRPLFLINGTDHDVPLRMEDQLFRAAGSPKQLWTVGGSRHGDYAILAPDEYDRRVLGFFRDALLG